MRLQFIFNPRDLWIGAYWDHKKRRLYILPVPCLGICLGLGKEPRFTPPIIPSKREYLMVDHHTQAALWIGVDPSAADGDKTKWVLASREGYVQSIFSEEALALRTFNYCKAQGAGVVQD